MLRKLLLPALLLALIGCSQSAMLQKFTSPEEQALARNYIELLHQQRFDEIEKVTDSSIATPALHDTLVKMAALIPPGEPTSVTLVGAHRAIMGNATTVNLTFEYGFSGKWLLANVATKRQGAYTTIVGLNVVVQSKSLAEQNKFTLSGKSPTQYLVLALALGMPLLSLYALVACIKTRLKGRKWLWIVFILFGFGQLATNWTTGQTTFNLLSFQLFSASAFASPYGPWTLAASLPLGAITFLLRRRKLTTPVEQSHSVE